MTPEREAKFRHVIANRWADLTVVLENVNDPHNVYAVMRTCDAVGIQEVYVLNTDQRWDETIGKRSSAGMKNWVDVQYFENLEDCVAVVKKKYGRILTTKLGESSTPLFDLDLTAPTALAFGNERHGISEAFAALSDGNFNIPQVGMAGSLNISVACAVSMYEAFRQRGSSNEKNDHLLPSDQAKILFERWQEKQRLKRHQKP